MSHKRNEALRHVQHSMHHVIAAGEGSDRAPDSCKLCPYYRPDFKFRTCLYAHCPYKKQVNVFRSTPEKWDILYALHSYDLLNQYAARSLAIVPENSRGYYWLIHSLKVQGMDELASNEYQLAKQHLTTEEYKELCTSLGDSCE